MKQTYNVFAGILSIRRLFLPLANFDTFFLLLTYEHILHAILDWKVIGPQADTTSFTHTVFH